MLQHKVIGNQSINEYSLYCMIKKFENSYAVRDKQDVLAMSALQFAAQVEQKNIETVEVAETIVHKIKALNDLLQDQLS